MRQIKFRAWSKVSKQIIGCYMWGLNMDFTNGQIYSGNLNVTENLELMQYTGLKDKNGTEIYEGDIVLVNDDFEEKGKVVWDKQELEYGIDLNTVQLKMGCYYSKELEIIGNIYENPELITE